MEKEKENIDQLIVDTIIEKPITFKLDGHFFYLYPPSLGVTLMSRELFNQFKINKTLASLSDELEIIRVCYKNKDSLYRVLAYHSFNDRKLATDENEVLKRIDEFSKIEIPVLQSLFFEVLKWYSALDKLKKEYKLDIEKKQREKIVDYKNKQADSSITFGGRSVYGTLIDSACEKYGWSYDYVLWGVSYTNLSMMLSDAVSSVYLTAKEKHHLHISGDRQIINGDNKANNKLLKKILGGI